MRIGDIVASTLSRYDRNQDGMINYKRTSPDLEVTDPDENDYMARLDSNRDRFVDTSEISDFLLRSVDVNGDGEVTAAEEALFKLNNPPVAYNIFFGKPAPTPPPVYRAPVPTQQVDVRAFPPATPYHAPAPAQQVDVRAFPPATPYKAAPAQQVDIRALLAAYGR